ncbi:MAG TPA: MFS transporter [Rhizobiaceae bacterium]
MLWFVNAAHFLVHYMVLIFPTAVIGMSGEFGLGYGEMIPLATVTMLAFGLLSLPVGLLVNPVGPARLLALYFLLIGLASVSVAFAGSYLSLAVTLLALGAAAAIYHPVGLTLLASVSHRLGRDLAVNGVWGNLGSALAAVITAALTQAFGWRFAFIIPGVVAVGFGIAYLIVRSPGGVVGTAGPSPQAAETVPVARPYHALASVIAAILAGGITYNIVTVALPKMVEEFLGSGRPLWAAGALTTLIFVCGAIMQLAAGRLIDRCTLTVLFIVLSALQLGGLLMAWAFAGPLVLVGLAITMAAIYGQVVVDDAIVARFVRGRRRGLAYGASYALGFAASALAIPLMGYLHARGAGFTPVLALTAACGGVLLACAVGFRLAVGRR